MSNIVSLPAGQRPRGRIAASPAPYAELISTSNFSFLRSGSHPEELVSAAMQLGLKALALTDRNSFSGIVRGYVAARDLHEAYPDFRYIVGVRLCFADGTPDIIAYPTNRVAYGRLCKLLTVANARGEKGNPVLYFTDLFGAGHPGSETEQGPPENYASEQLFVLLANEQDWALSETVLQKLVAEAAGSVWVAGTPRFDGMDRERLNRLADLGQRHGAPLLASNDVLYHEPNRRMVQDVVTCIRQHMTLEEAGLSLHANAERHLKPAAEMARLFREHPDAIAQTAALLARIDFSLDQLKYNYPDETVGTGETAQQTLERLTWIGAQRRFPFGVPDSIKRTIWNELSLIGYKGYAAYFLTVYDIVQHARYGLKILCQGRGSAANSAVCYCLEITEVNPETGNLVFGRFISTERDEPPDIDVDFEHERREEIMAYIYQKYGGKRTGLTANVITYRSKSAVRETAKVFGVSDDIVAALNQMHWGWGSKLDLADLASLGLSPDDATLAQMFEVVKVLRGFPRHLSQHVGGFVITRDSLESLVPIGKTAMESRTIIEWNKDDIDALAILKVDILALGMLSCLRRAFEMVERHYGRHLALADLMAEEKDPDQSKKARVFAMIQRADTLGVFQIESRAQMSMLPRLKPKEFYDLIIEVAIVRPGPIQGNMVHPYLRRRQGLEEPVYYNDKLKAVLGRTLGIPLFQEQAMQMAIVGAGFSPGKADSLRRAMAAWRRTGKMAQFGEDFIQGMLANGYPLDFAKNCFAQIQGFAEYGFPESHAASFALLVYASCWFKCHYPDVFACALLNSQPMGFYAPSQIIRDAIEHGVEILPVDVNLSDLECVLEPASAPASTRLWRQHAEMTGDILSTHAVRLGMHYAQGLAEKDINLIVARRGAGYDSVRDLWLRTGVPIASLEKLARADGFASLGLSRREALWAVKGLVGTHGADTLPLFAASGPVVTEADAEAGLPKMLPGEEVIHDYSSLSFSLKGHPLQFIRPLLDARKIVRSHQLMDVRPGSRVEVAGLVLVRQRPGTAKGVIFATLEDETGVANVVIWPKVFEANRKTVLSARMLAVRGQLQREGLVVHIIAEQVTDMTQHLLDLAHGHDIGDRILARGDEGKSGPVPSRDRAAMLEIERARRAAHNALPGGRNFH
jgi:error-prone DNA polymerase